MSHANPHFPFCIGIGTLGRNYLIIAVHCRTYFCWASSNLVLCNILLSFLVFHSRVQHKFKNIGEATNAMVGIFRNGLLGAWNYEGAEKTFLNCSNEGS